MREQYKRANAKRPKNAEQRAKAAEYMRARRARKKAALQPSKNADTLSECPPNPARA